jgi:uncharacterized membrane protein
MRRINMKRNFSIAMALFLIITVFSQVPAQAADYEGYYSSQMIMNFQGKPGDEITKTLRFFNDTPDEAQAGFAVRDFNYENNSIIYVVDRPNSFSVNKWTNLNVDTVKVQSKGYVDVKVTVNIPEEAEMGEHMALLEGSFLPASSLDSQMKIKTEIAPVIYVQVTDKNGFINLDKKWNLLGVEKDVLNGGHFIFSVENKGNVHLESQGKMKITNIITKKVKEKKIPRVNLLPNNKKDILVRWNIDDYIGIYKADVTFSMDGEKTEKINTTLFIIPWFLVGIVLTTILLVILFMRMYIKRLKKKWLAEAANDLLSTKASS